MFCGRSIGGTNHVSSAYSYHPFHCDIDLPICCIWPRWWRRRKRRRQRRERCRRGHRWFGCRGRRGRCERRSGNGGTIGSPNATATGLGRPGVSGANTGLANPGGLNNPTEPNRGPDQSRTNTSPGTNALGTANSAGGAGGGGNTGVAANSSANNGSITTARRAGSATANGRIDGTVTPGPLMPGDASIQDEKNENDMVDKKINGICRGC